MTSDPDSNAPSRCTRQPSNFCPCHPTPKTPKMCGCGCGCGCVRACDCAWQSFASGGLYCTGLGGGGVPARVGGSVEVFGGFGVDLVLPSCFAKAPRTQFIENVVWNQLSLHPDCLFLDFPNVIPSPLPLGGETLGWVGLGSVGGSWLGGWVLARWVGLGSVGGSQERPFVPHPPPPSAKQMTAVCLCACAPCVCMWILSWGGGGGAQGSAKGFGLAHARMSPCASQWRPAFQERKEHARGRAGGPAQCAAGPSGHDGGRGQAVPQCHEAYTAAPARHLGLVQASRPWLPGQASRLAPTAASRAGCFEGGGGGQGCA